MSSSTLDTIVYARAFDQNVIFLNIYSIFYHHFCHRVFVWAACEIHAHWIQNLIFLLFVFGDGTKNSIYKVAKPNVYPQIVFRRAFRSIWASECDQLIHSNAFSRWRWHLFVRVRRWDTQVLTWCCKTDRHHLHSNSRTYVHIYTFATNSTAGGANVAHVRFMCVCVCVFVAKFFDRFKRCEKRVSGSTDRLDAGWHKR